MRGILRRKSNQTNTHTHTNILLKLYGENASEASGPALVQCLDGVLSTARTRLKLHVLYVLAAILPTDAVFTLADALGEQFTLLQRCAFEYKLVFPSTSSVVRARLIEQEMCIAHGLEGRSG